MMPQGTGRPVAASGGFGGQESISLGEAHADAAARMGRSPRSTRLEVKPSEPEAGREHACRTA